MTAIDFGTDWPAKEYKMLESGPTGPLKLQTASRGMTPSPLPQAEMPAGYMQSEDREHTFGQVLALRSSHVQKKNPKVATEVLCSLVIVHSAGQRLQTCTFLIDSGYGITL